MSLGTAYPGLVHGSVGVRGGCGGTPTDPQISSCRLLVPGQSISPAPGGHRRVQSGVTRVMLLIAGEVLAEENRPPCTLHGGLVGQAGTSMQAVCRPRHARVSLT